MNLNRFFIPYKKSVLLFCILFLFSCNTQSQVNIQTQEYSIVYSEELEQPLKVTYTITCPDGDFPRYDMSFWKPSNFHTSDDDDYEDNIWDKGHIVPVASFSCSKKSLKSIYSYANCTLQHQSLNRGVWRKLEEFERDLAHFYDVNVEVEVIFKDDPYRVPGGAAVPIGYVKIITWSSKTLKLHFPNEDTVGTHWYDYIVEYK